MIIAIIGATGLVGTEITRQIEKKKEYENYNVLFVASKKNIGKKIKYKNKHKNIISIKDAIKKKPNYVFFSAGSQTSIKYATKFVEQGGTVIDNSSAFRMNPKHKLIVPEINGHTLTKKDKIIANPNCSTIQLVLPIHPIHREFNIKRIVVSTYQAVSGSGNKGLEQLNKEKENKKTKEPAYPMKIFNNILPHCDEFNKDGYTKEEQKIINETNKILNSKINITATAVRVPTTGGHGESVNIELKKTAKIEIPKKK